MKDTFKALAQAETNLRKCEATLQRADERAAERPTACNVLLQMYAQDDVDIHKVAFEAAKDAHLAALAVALQLEGGVEYISFGPVCNPDGSPTEFTKRMFGIS